MNSNKNYRIHIQVFLIFLLFLFPSFRATYFPKILQSITQNRAEYASRILNAVWENDLTEVKFLVEGKASSPMGNETRIVACVAAEVGKVDIIRYLTEEEPSILELKDEQNETIIHIAAKYGRVDIIRYIAEEKPSIFEEHKESIFITANKHQRHRLILFLARKMDSVYFKRYGSGRGIPILHLAAVRNFLDLESLKFFVEKKHFNLSTIMTEKNETVAHLAVKHDQLDLVQYILNVEPSLVRQKDSEQRILAELALKRENLDMVRCILEYSISTSTIDRYELGAYKKIAYTAVFKADMAVTRLVVEKCPAVLAENYIGATLAHVAAAHGHADVLEYLATSRPEMLTKQGAGGWNTPLHFAAQRNLNMTLAFVRFLVKGTGNAALLRNVYGQTVPEIAAKNGNLNIIRCVLEELPSFNDSCKVAEMSIRYSHPQIFWYIAQKRPAELADEQLLSVAFEERLLSMETLQTEGLPLLEDGSSAPIIARIAKENGQPSVVGYIAKKNPSAFTKKEGDG